ncbi:MAG: hypothetical protein IT310_14560 [Anaerolineales bacterium]|nr:hypothetical protein [Anaerolineales bacterium]
MKAQFNLKREAWLAYLFNLSEKGAKFRNLLSVLLGGIAWLGLSGMTAILSAANITDRFQLIVIIILSFLKYIPVLFVIYFLGRGMAARYLADIFELEDEAIASRFLKKAAFGVRYEEDIENSLLGKLLKNFKKEEEDETKKKEEKVTILEGKISKNELDSSILLIGGPGQIQVNLDSIAVVEGVNGVPKVIYPRKKAWRLEAFERIREIGKSDKAGEHEYAMFSLKDLFTDKFSVKTHTKDGIPIEAHGIKVIFNVLRAKEAAESTDRENGFAYSFDEDAVQTLVYGQTLTTPSPSGQNDLAFPWNTSVIPLITSEIERILTSHTLNEILTTTSQKEADIASANQATISQIRLEITGKREPANNATSAPSGFQTRAELTAHFFQEPFVEKAKKLGIAISWIDIGTWLPSSPVILNKHKEALALMEENKKFRAKIANSRKAYENREIVNLIKDIVLENFKSMEALIYNRGYRDLMFLIQRLESKNLGDATPAEKDETKAILTLLKSEAQSRTMQQPHAQDNAKNVAQKILNAFRTELITGRDLIQKEDKPASEKQAQIAKIDKALYDIEHLTYHILK